MSGDNNIRRGMGQPEDQEFDPQADNGEFYEEPFEGGDMGEPTEDWEAYDSEFAGDEGGEDAGSARKKNSTFTMLLVGGAVLVGAFIFWMTVMNKPPARQQAVKTASSTQAPSTPSGVDPNAPTVPALSEGIQSAEKTQESPKGGLLNDDAQLNGLAAHISSSVEKIQHDAPLADVNEPPMPSPMATARQPDNGALTPMPASAGADMTEAQPEPGSMPAPVPVADTNSPPAIESATPFMKADAKAQQPVPSAPADARKPESPQTPPAPANDALEAKIDALAERIGSLESKLASLPSQNNIQSLIHSVDGIESRLDRLEKNPSAPANPAPVAAEADDQDPGMLQPAPPARVKAVPSRAAASKTQKSAARWILKSAQPGLAYVSQAGRDDMVTIRVGEMLPGIGRVNSIAIVNGRWMVSGSEGSISQ